MGMTDDSSEYLKIDEAARLLRVTRRTVYRRIWSGELPATKVGGLYLIQREDLQAMLTQGRVTSPSDVAKPEAVLPPLKCGNCFRLIGSDAQIGEVCQKAGCDQLICVLCLAEGVQYCVQHSPTKEQKLEEAMQRFRQGEIPVLVRGNIARLRELNFVNRIQARISRIGTLIHPLSGELLTIQDWDTLLDQGDQREDVMHLLSKVMLDTETLTRVPLNAFLYYRIPQRKQPRSLPLEILVQSLSRLPVMLRDGFDTQPLNADDLTPFLVRLSEEAQQTQTFRLVVLAAVTGWDASARQAIQGETRGGAFVHRSALFYIFDLEKGELLYNLEDDRLRRYAELFAPLLLSEELEEVIQSIEKELLVYESLTLQYAAQVLPYPQDLIRQAFERLAAAGRYALTEVPELGLAIVRK